jgi:O-antigen/teichoic acid export membrane protein
MVLHIPPSLCHYVPWQNSVIVKNFVDFPEEKGEAIGSAIGLRLLSSTLSIGIIILISFFLDRGEPETIIVVALLCGILLFHAFDTIAYYFQSLYQSKYQSTVSLIGYAVASVYKIILLLLGKSVRWFALATSVDYIVIAILLLAVYKRRGGPKLSYSWRKGKELLSKSYHYILSGAMVAIYGQVDKLMLKHMIDQTSVGYYSIAVSISNMWVFVLAAIIDSMYPTILQLHKEDRNQFDRKNRQLYGIVFYVSIGVSTILTVLTLCDFDSLRRRLLTVHWPVICSHLVYRVLVSWRCEKCLACL